MDEIFIGTHISLVPVPLTLVPGSNTFAHCCIRYHPSGTMVPLPCHPPLVSYNLSMIEDAITPRNREIFKPADSEFLQKHYF